VGQTLRRDGCRGVWSSRGRLGGGRAGGSCFEERERGHFAALAQAQVAGQIPRPQRIHFLSPSDQPVRALEGWGHHLCRKAWAGSIPGRRPQAAHPITWRSRPISRIHPATRFEVLKVGDATCAGRLRPRPFPNASLKPRTRSPTGAAPSRGSTRPAGSNSRWSGTPSKGPSRFARGEKSGPACNPTAGLPLTGLAPLARIGPVRQRAHRLAWPLGGAQKSAALSVTICVAVERSALSGATAS